MKKDEILSKSREENKKRDPYALEVQANASAISGLTALALTTVFFVIQSVVGRGFNFGLYAVAVSFGGVNFLVKAIYLKQKKDVVLAIVYLVVTLILSVIHIANLLSL